MAVPMRPSTTAACEGLLHTWRAAMSPLGFEEREKPPGEYRWRRETTGLKMTLEVGIQTLGYVGSIDVPSDLVMVRLGWSVTARDGKRWLRVDHSGRTLFPPDVQGDIWYLHDGIATTQFSGWDHDVLGDLSSLGSTFASFASELSDRTTARRFVAALQHTRVVN